MLKMGSWTIQVHFWHLIVIMVYHLLAALGPNHFVQRLIEE